MEKLPEILKSSKMLICGEDLGFVPDCVPKVMDDLAITRLHVQRMPRENTAYSDPKNSGYMSVVTTSTHDSSTLRQWWQENRTITQQYFRTMLGQYGTAPWSLLPELAEIIVKQHLFSPAMLAIFPLQDILAMHYDLANEQQDAERINDPSVFPHYWRYRMHIKIEHLLENTAFSERIAGWAAASGRA